MLFGSSVSGTQVIQQERESGTGHLGHSCGSAKVGLPQEKMVGSQITTANQSLVCLTYDQSYAVMCYSGHSPSV